MSSIPIPNDFNKVLYQPLAEADPEVQEIIERETYRQFRGLELIASENLTSLATMEANGSILTNKYSEGLPGARYYGGNEFIDQLEVLTQKRALETFDLDPNVWGVNVQSYSGSTANFAAFTALLQPQDRVMGLALPDGGHLTHGYYTAKKKITASAIYFQSFPYQVDRSTGLIDHERLKANANLFKPRLVVCGGSAYPRDWDYKFFYEVAKANGSYLLCDMAHISGLVAAKEMNSPFEYCDIVTTTTHKTLRGPRAGLIFFRKDREADIEARVNAAVFPACQGGPHNNTISAVCVALKQASDPAFKNYAKQVRANAQALAAKLFSYGYKLQTDGSDNHLVLWDLRPIGLTGSKIEKLCDLVHITLNKNAVAGDTSAVVPGGVRIGANALTSRSMNEKDMEKVAEFLHRVVEIAGVLQKEAGSKLLKDFVAKATTGDGEGRQQLKQLSVEVQEFATKFPLPGVPDSASIKRFPDAEE
ncbi:glycine hydroxymethyltransferase [Malassezia vespertilionis]|uniref:Serine hydroxymethyltransferase n=1 Tax=Malassezia vespertilionis TaxID=2020962 RepID=A0A2N1JCB6_9BASI|nr:glycine hydroxymethyltransferase [Malassezia vespertilionis]PKI84177.1 Shm2p [Malassezia vespertilionis]WFD06933.1 glycine hydroxymethyltransferase [Malassezia vespertilionis]